MMTLELRQQCDKPMCSDVFPELSDMLEDDKYQLAIRVVGWFKKWERYSSLEDFVFVEMFPKWRSACVRYYDGKGPSLSEDPNVDDEMLDKWDEFLCKCVDMAYQCAFNRVTTSWERFARICHKQIEMQ